MTRKTWVLAGGVLAAAGVLTGIVLGTSDGKQRKPAAQETLASTAKVVKGDLSATVSLAGILTYRGQSDGSPYPVINQAQGTYTKLPDLGQEMSQGQVLYRVNDIPVVLLYGSTPAYRSLSPGTTGADVAQLNGDLDSLGYATSAQLDPKSAYFGSATVAALEKLQAAIDVAQTGVLTLGQAVFEPNAVRITALSAPLGASAQTGQTVMRATSTIRDVQVALDASQQTDMAAGDKVIITLPNNQTTPGVVSSVGAVATCPPASGPAGSSTDSTGPGNDTCSTASSQTTAPTITVVVTPSNAAATGSWDQAPVKVSIITANVPDALAVPVTALLAQVGGSYAVEVVGPGEANHLVPVSLGLFDDADGLVQVVSSKLTAGQEVVVPTI